MPFGLSVVTLAALAQAAGAAPASGPATGPTTAAATVPKPAADGCRTPAPDKDSRIIIVCAQRPEGYRLDPDVMQARREARNRSGPKARQLMQDNPCTTVGPMGCRGNAGIDLMQAASVLAQMADKASKGENVGQIFVTDPQPTEYQLYLEAKKLREAKQAADAARKARQAKAPHTGPGQAPLP